MKRIVASRPVIVLCLSVLVLTQLACAVMGSGIGLDPTPTLYVIPTNPPAGGGQGDLPPAPTPEQPSGGETGATVDACTLLTQQDAESIFGAPSQPGSGSGDETQGVFVGGCTYYSADNTQVLIFNVTRGTTPARDSIAFTLDSPQFEHLPGLGDDAIWDTSTSTLTVAKGLWWFSLTGVVTGGASVTQDQWLPIAQRIVGQIP